MRRFPPRPSRRTLIQGLALLGAGAALPTGLWPSTVTAAPAPAPALEVMTVTGPVPAQELGMTLSHEHVTTDFLGAEKLTAPRYDRAVARDLIRPHLTALRERGVRTLFECTPAHIGRDVRLLRDLSEATGLRIVTNTGYYGAAEDRFLPRHAFTESEEALAVHTGDGAAARDELRLLTAQGLAPDALVWVHAQNDPGPVQMELARQGVWISLDGFSLAHRNPERYVNMVVALKNEGLLHRVLLSQDDGWAVEGEAAQGSTLKLFGNGNPQPYRSLFDHGRAAFATAGISDDEWHRLFVLHPAEAFALRKRLA